LGIEDAMKDDAQGREQEQGFLLLGLIVAIFIILLTLSVAAPKMARELRREREVETVHRGNQYVRAIQLYYRKFGHYPGSMEQLDKSNMIRFLRQDYVDPMTGKADWRIIKVGENKTTVKGFFGKPLAGLPTSGLGSAAGMASSFGSSGTAPGSSSQGSAFGNSGSIGSALGGTSSPTSGLGPSGVGTSSSSSSNTAGGETGASSSSGGMQSISASNFTGNSGPFIGVGLVKDGDSIITLNEQTTYNTWEFIYDPRIEQLKAKAAMMGGGATGFGSSSGSGSSSGPGSSSPFGNSMGFGNPTSPTTNGTGSGSTGTTSPPNPNPQ